MVATAHTLVLTGTMATGAGAQQAEAIARAYLGDGQTLVDDLTVLSAIQVNVRVRVIEISRQITRELGFNWQALFSSGGLAIGFATSGASAPFLAAPQQPRRS